MNQIQPLNPTLNETERQARVLVAATDAENAMETQGWLIAAGMTNVRATADVREVAALYAKWPFQLLLLDLRNPEPHALDFIRPLAAAIQTNRLGLIAVVALAQSQDAEDARVLGALEVMAEDQSAAEMVSHARAAIDAMEQRRLNQDNIMKKYVPAFSASH